MIDPKKIKGFQKTLEERGGGDDLFLNASKIEGSIDVRLLDPLPNMDGMYALEIPVWWVGKTKIVSPDMFGGNDIVQIMLDEAKAATDDAELQALLSETNDFKQPKIRKHIEYWIPIIVFDWKIHNDEIVGIYNEADEYDVNLIDQFVRGKKGMILNCKTQLTKAINAIATQRGGNTMFDQNDGFNVILERAGKGRETVYRANKDVNMPMPAKYYGEGTPDVMSICKAAIFTEEYIDQIMGNHLYGEELPEKTDACYAFPEVRAELKKGDVKVEAPKAKRSRPGTAPAQTDEATATTAQEETATAPAPAARPARGTGNAKRGPAPDAPKTSRSRGGRNVAADLQEVKDD